MAFGNDIAGYIDYLEENIYSSESETKIIFDGKQRYPWADGVFSGIFGFTPREYVRKRRLYLAALDLLEGYTVADVIVKYAFFSYSTFSKAFKAMYGIPPARIERNRIYEYPRLECSISIKGADIGEKKYLEGKRELQKGE